jgi:hypothetical protein
LKNIPDIKAAQTGVFKINESETGWDYCVERRAFYTRQEGAGIAEKGWVVL